MSDRMEYEGAKFWKDLGKTDNCTVLLSYLVFDPGWLTIPTRPWFYKKKHHMQMSKR